MDEPPARELKLCKISFSAFAGSGERMGTRTRRTSSFKDLVAGLTTAVIGIPASFAFTTMRSATLCSSASAESYPNTMLGEGVICDQSSLARGTSAAVEKRKDVPLDHCGSSAPV